MPTSEGASIPHRPGPRRRKRGRMQGGCPAEKGKDAQRKGIAPSSGEKGRTAVRGCRPSAAPPPAPPAFPSCWCHRTGSPVFDKRPWPGHCLPAPTRRPFETPAAARQIWPPGEDGSRWLGAERPAAHRGRKPRLRRQGQAPRKAIAAKADDGICHNGHPGVFTALGPEKGRTFGRASGGEKSGMDQTGVGFHPSLVMNGANGVRIGPGGGPQDPLHGDTSLQILK